MKIKLFGLALVAALIAGASAIAAGNPIVARQIGVGQMQATTIHAKAGAMILDSITIAPGGSFGWHTHGSAVAVVVTAGTLTVFDPDVAKCAPFKVSKGQAFIEPAGHVHLARNEGTAPAKVYAMYLGIPKGAQANIAGTAPKGCSA